MTMTRFLRIAAVALVAACTSIGTDATANVAGDWVTTSEQPLSTIITGLSLQQSGESLAARVSFSGVQMDGTGTVSGSNIALTFSSPGSTARIDGRLEGALLRVSLLGAGPNGTAIESALRRR
jgi:hypothetical protein